MPRQLRDMRALKEWDSEVVETVKLDLLIGGRRGGSTIGMHGKHNMLPKMMAGQVANVHLRWDAVARQSGRRQESNTSCVRTSKRGGGGSHHSTSRQLTRSEGVLGAVMNKT